MKKNTPLKIGLVVDDGLDRLDGVQKYVVTIGEYFKSRGHDVHYLAGETKRTDLTNIHSLSKNMKVVFNGGNQLSIPLPASSSKIKKLLNDQKFDVLHVQTPYSPFMAGKLIKRASKDTVVIGTFHILPYGKLQYLGSKILGFLQKNTLKRFDKFLSVSKPAQEFAKSTFNIKSSIMPNPVDIKVLSAGKKRRTSAVKIVYLGRLVRRKGCLELLNAINIMNKLGLAKVDYTLDILGDGAMRQELEDLVDKRGLKKFVNFRGYVNDKEKAEYLRDADIAVFPSLGGESFGIVLVEAMAAGAKVVIGGDNPGYRSVIEDDNLLFNPKDTDKLAVILSELVNSPKLREEINIKQKKHINKYDISVIGEDLINLYVSCKNAKT